MRCVFSVSCEHSSPAQAAWRVHVAPSIFGSPWGFVGERGTNAGCTVSLSCVAPTWPWPGCSREHLGRELWVGRYGLHAGTAPAFGAGTGRGGEMPSHGPRAWVCHIPSGAFNFSFLMVDWRVDYVVALWGLHVFLARVWQRINVWFQQTKVTPASELFFSVW